AVKTDLRPAPRFDPPRPRGDAVLVIEDNATAREALQRLLTQKGFRAKAAASGEEGLRLARELHPLAIMLDLVMPGTDGWAVLRAVKTHPDLADIPVVLFTGMADEGSEAFRRGAADFVPGPQDFQDQRRGLAGVHTIADDEAAVIIQERYQVDAAVLPF